MTGKSELRVTSKVEDWLPAEEYSSLRTEMLERFERIFKVKTFGILSWAGLIGFYLESSSKGAMSVSSETALSVLHFIVLLIGLFIIRMQKSIYKIGSYIQANFESEIEIGWHEANRNFDFYNKYGELPPTSIEEVREKQRQYWKKLSVLEKVIEVFKVTRSSLFDIWGADNVQHFFLIVTLYCLSVTAIIGISEDSINFFFEINVLSKVVLIVLLIVNMLNALKFLLLGQERKKAYKWKEYIYSIRGQKHEDITTKVCCKRCKMSEFRKVNDNEQLKALLDIYKDQRERAKDYEKTKDNYNYFTMILTAGLVTGYVAVDLEIVKIILSFFIILLACYGLQYNRKMYDRFKLRYDRSTKLREYIDSEFLQNQAENQFREVDENYNNNKYELSYEDSWNVLYNLAFLLGVSLFAYALVLLVGSLSI